MQRRTDIQSRTAVKPMKCLRIKDNRQVKKTEFREIENLTERIVDKTLDRLEQEGIFVFPGMLQIPTTFPEPKRFCRV